MNLKRWLWFLTVEERTPKVIMLPSGLVLANPVHAELLHDVPAEKLGLDRHMPAWDVRRRWRWEW